MTISELKPNTAYVFAIIAINDKAKFVPDFSGIGFTSEKIVTLLPLPLGFCWGYVSLVSRQLLEPEGSPNTRYSKSLIGFMTRACEKVLVPYIADSDDTVNLATQQAEPGRKSLGYAHTRTYPSLSLSHTHTLSLSLSLSLALVQT